LIEPGQALGLLFHLLITHTKVTIMDRKKYSYIAFWFLVILNILSLFDSILSTKGVSIFSEPEFQNLLLLALIHKLSKDNSTKQKNADVIS